MVDAVRVQSQSVSRLLAYRDPIAGAKVPSRAARRQPESLVVLVEHLGDDVSAIASEAAVSLVRAFRG